MLYMDQAHRWCCTQEMCISSLYEESLRVWLVMLMSRIRSTELVRFPLFLVQRIKFFQDLLGGIFQISKAGAWLDIGKSVFLSHVALVSSEAVHAIYGHLFLL